MKIRPERHVGLGGKAPARGNYLAEIEASAIVHDELVLWIALRRRGWIEETVLRFCIHDKDAWVRYRARCLVQDFAEAMNVAILTDSSQLHDIPFKLTVWNADPFRFSCRPVGHVESRSPVVRGDDPLAA
jgi:hypothetical protein